MAETILDRGMGRQWHLDSISNDLTGQGQLVGVSIDLFSLVSIGASSTFKGRFNGNHFSVDWAKDFFTRISMEEFDQALVDGFTRVLEYDPFCRYVEDDGCVTVEWDKRDPAGRFRDLESDSSKRDLERLSFIA